MKHWRSLRAQLAAIIAMLSAMAGTSSRTASAQEFSEDVVWQQAQVRGTVEAYETYLRRFPLGKYTREAYRCAVVLAAQQQSPGYDLINAPTCVISGLVQPQDVEPAAGPTPVAPAPTPSGLY